MMKMKKHIAYWDCKVEIILLKPVVLDKLDQA